MKKALFLFALLTIGLTLAAQTVIKEDQTRVVSIDTMLISGESVNIDWYGKDFFENTRVHVVADTATGTGTGDVVMTVITQGSLNYVDFYPLDTVTISGSDDNAAVSPKTVVYYDYLRHVVAVAGTGDSVDVTLNLLFDVNE